MKCKLVSRKGQWNSMFIIGQMQESILEKEKRYVMHLLTWKKPQRAKQGEP